MSAHFRPCYGCIQKELTEHLSSIRVSICFSFLCNFADCHNVVMYYFNRRDDLGIERSMDFTTRDQTCNFK